jgi:cytochrome c
VINDAEAPGYGFHDVYTQPEVVKTFLETGQFPNGTVLIKEVRKIISRTLTTGPVVWAGDTSVWFVMIKDTKGRFKDSANWGEGWGWACLKPKPEHQYIQRLSGKLPSLPCAGKTNRLGYIEGYPTLRSQ